ncbi:MAG: hypothetical protein KME10_13850 [Plectolyngbya sp. WJT66-NPBG17]|jgi:transposase-like protein|nr:hypothetical protein [Plectolyngbya sp. WJT66-NPBG17]MBW4526377.1 hypothetical protein [Phormidium tanganyikae FI6-MK23]
MSRLSDSDKSQIIELYRQSGETTLTLAERYGVSNTTISRILKSSLSADEYDSLIQQKRSASRGGSKIATATIGAPPVQGSLLEVADLDPVQPEAVEPEIAEPKRVIESRAAEPAKAAVSSKPAPPRRVQRQTVPDEEELAAIAPPTEKVAQVNTVEAIANEDLTPNRGGMMDDDDDDLEDDLDDLDNLDEDLEDDDDEPAILPSIQLNAAEFIRVLPIAEAAIPRTCYLVVDRAAELVARPLSEFAELGQIPSGEVEERTLPVFDNHRVAKRFSNIRTQRVIKVPDSRVLQKAAPYLQAKGITRLLIDGQVYAL